jgi:hypothetical protein
VTDQIWWADTIQKSLSQGDIVIDLPLFSVPNPIPFLTKQSVKHGQTAWFETPVQPKSAAKINALAGGAVVGAVVGAIILSHSCELDKSRSNPRVLLAPIMQLDLLGANQEMKDKIVMQQLHAMLPLPDVPRLGTCVADLRALTNVPRPTVDAGTRSASMTDASLRRMAAQLVAFFMRLQLPPEISDTINVQVAD